MNDVTLATPASASRPCKLAEWKRWPVETTTLRGHAVIDFSGWCVAHIPVGRRNDSTLWVGTPSMPAGERDGKKIYTPLITFSSPEAKHRWQRMVLTALDAAGIVP